MSADKQEESNDSGCDYSQQSEFESSENSVALEMEDDSTSLSQAALDELLEASEKNVPIPYLSGDLEGKLYLTECVRTILCARTYTCMYNKTVAVTYSYDLPKELMWDASSIVML